ncbi:hypothetical protein ACQP2U_25055 [Nocardia sp. CA-084685]|uniref:hypothetical protein n=1 Tax=Nocardia sp. CA-084685 TaxID=3239970 RepID=UPI003D972798
MMTTPNSRRSAPIAAVFAAMAAASVMAAAPAFAATVPLTADPSQPPLASGSEAQVRVALVDRDGIVVSGQAKKFTVP